MALQSLEAEVEENGQDSQHLPTLFESYVNEKSSQNGGGRPHFLQELAKKGDPTQRVLDILELAWIKNKSLRLIARRVGTGYHTIYRLVQDLEPFKEELVIFLSTTPRRKQFYNEKLDTSDYETVQNYIRHAHRKPVRRYKSVLGQARRCWTFLKYKDPSNWTADEILDFLGTLSRGAKSSMLDKIRCVAPQIGDKHSPDYVETGKFRDMLSYRLKEVFGEETKMIHEALRQRKLDYEKTIFDLHVTLGAREGTVNPDAGMCGLSWDRFKKGFATVDLWESKVKGGIWSRNCPVDLLFKDLPARLEAIWKKRGKPAKAKVIVGGYKELTAVYKTIRKVLRDYWQGKVEPSILKEFATLQPHDSDKIHCNLLWEAEVPVEVVAGKYLGRGEALGLMGRVWLSTETITKHYLACTQRSERYKKVLKNVEDYAHRFNGVA